MQVQHLPIKKMSTTDNPAGSRGELRETMGYDQHIMCLACRSGAINDLRQHCVGDATLFEDRREGLNDFENWCQNMGEGTLARVETPTTTDEKKAELGDTPGEVEDPPNRRTLPGHVGTLTSSWQCYKTVQVQKDS